MSEAGIGFSPEGRFKRKLTDKILNGLKCYEIIDGEITGMSLVDVPAHSYKAKIVSEEERTIMGPVLIPGKMIYRINPITGEEHYIFFTAEVIKKLFSGYRKENWTEQERYQLLYMRSEGKTEKEIALLLDREENDVVAKIISQGEPFRNMLIILMLQKNKTFKEIGELLKISEPQILNICIELGGKITKIDP